MASLHGVSLFKLEEGKLTVEFNPEAMHAGNPNIKQRKLFCSPPSVRMQIGVRWNPSGWRALLIPNPLYFPLSLHKATSAAFFYNQYGCVAY